MDQQVEGRGPNLPLPGLSTVGYMSWASWNLRAAFHSDPILLKAKLKQMNRLARAHSISIFQEVHGNRELVDRMAASFGWPNLFHIWYFPNLQNGIPVSDAGGILLLVKKVQFDGWQLSCDSLIDGRFLRFQAWRTIDSNFEQRFVVYGAHNYGISNPQMNLIERTLGSDIDKAKHSPLQHFVSVIGDLNFPPDGQEPMPLSTVQRTRVVNVSGAGPATVPVAAGLRPFQGRWNKLLGKLIEFDLRNETHFNSSSLSLNTLDRAWASLPPSAIPGSQTSGSVWGNPIDWHVKRISDHSPISIKVAQLIGKRDLPYRISKEVSRHPMFARLSNRLIAAAELHLEPINKAVDLCKFFIQEAAIQTRQFILNNQPQEKCAGFLGCPVLPRQYGKEMLNLQEP